MTAMDATGTETEHILQALAVIQAAFAPDAPAGHVFGPWLAPLQALTGSRFALVAEWNDDGTRDPMPVLLASSLAAHDEHAAAVLSVEIEQLLQATARSARPVISNGPAAGNPGAPVAFLGLPLQVGGQVVGVVALGNRPHGYEPEQAAQLAPLLHVCAHLLALYLEHRQRRVLDARLRVTAGREQAIWETSADALLLLSAGGVIEAANPAALRLTGCTAQALIGRSLAGLVQTQQWPALALQMERRVEQHRQPAVLCDRLGQPIDAELILTRVAQSAGVGYCCTIRDVRTSRGQAVELARVCDELSLILAACPLGVAAFDEHLRLAYCNPALLQLLGWESTEVQDLTFDTFEQRFNALCPPGQPAQSALEQHGDECIIRLERPRPLVVARTRRRLADVPGASLVLYLRDITRQNETERRKSQFMATAAHELRGPLTSILGFSELLTSRAFHPETQHDLQHTILRHARSLHRLVNELFDIAQIEARAERAFAIAPHPVEPLLSSCLAQLQHQHPQREISFEPPGREVPSVCVDPQRLEQMMQQVLANALHYSASDAPVTLRLLRDDRHRPGLLGIEVEDRGIGMSADEMRQASQRFYRAHPGSPVAGAGLGLALVRDILEAHGGALSLDSTPGQGTRVVLWLPQAGEVT